MLKSYSSMNKNPLKHRRPERRMVVLVAVIGLSMLWSSSRLGQTKDDMVVPVGLVVVLSTPVFCLPMVI